MPCKSSAHATLPLLTMIRLLAILFCVLVLPLLGAEEKPKTPLTLPEPEVVLKALKKAASTLRRDVSFAGGYAWSWPRDMSIARSENRESPSLIAMQPPGTPAVGMAMLNAYTASGDVLFLQGAREAAQALMWCQLSSGGWDSDFDFDPRQARRYHFRRDVEAGDVDPAGRHADSTLDDQKTQASLLFLLELAHTDASKKDPALRAALDFGLKGLLAAQAPCGAWGQHYEGPSKDTATDLRAKIPTEWPRIWPAVDYTPFHTLNDGNLEWVMRLLLRAHELEKDERYIAAARKLGGFLIRAQLPDPQPGWAQQYNFAMEPVWARKFEPPAVSSIESVGAMEALLQLWLATGEEEFLRPLPAAIAWLEKSRLSDGRWARFYELGTNKPLYCKAKTYEITHDDSDLPTHYGFKIDPDLATDIQKIQARMKAPREETLAKQALPTEPKKWASRAKGAAAKANTALSSQNKQGLWTRDNEIDAGEMVKHMRALAYYLEAARKGGAAFETLRAEVKSKAAAQGEDRAK